MEAKIKEVQDYFKNRIVSGDYNVAVYNTNYLAIIIDTHQFNIWIGSGADYFRTWELVGGYTISLPPFTKEEQEHGYFSAMKYVDSNAEQIRQARITALEKELNALKGI